MKIRVLFNFYPIVEMLLNIDLTFLEFLGGISKILANSFLAAPAYLGELRRWKRNLKKHNERVIATYNPTFCCNKPSEIYGILIKDLEVTYSLRENHFRVITKLLLSCSNLAVLLNILDTADSLTDDIIKQINYDNKINENTLTNYEKILNGLLERFVVEIKKIEADLKHFPGILHAILIDRFRDNYACMFEMVESAILLSSWKAYLENRINDANFTSAHGLTRALLIKELLCNEKNFFYNYFYQQDNTALIDQHAISLLGSNISKQLVRMKAFERQLRKDIIEIERGLADYETSDNIISELLRFFTESPHYKFSRSCFNAFETMTNNGALSNIPLLGVSLQNGELLFFSGISTLLLIGIDIYCSKWLGLTCGQLDAVLSSSFININNINIVAKRLGCKESKAVNYLLPAARWFSGLFVHLTIYSILFGPRLSLLGQAGVRYVLLTGFQFIIDYALSVISKPTNMLSRVVSNYGSSLLANSFFYSGQDKEWGSSLDNGQLKHC